MAAADETGAGSSVETSNNGTASTGGGTSTHDNIARRAKAIFLLSVLCAVAVPIGWAGIALTATLRVLPAAWAPTLLNWRPCGVLGPLLIVTLGLGLAATGWRINRQRLNPCGLVAMMLNRADLLLLMLCN